MKLQEEKKKSDFEKLMEGCGTLIGLMLVYAFFCFMAGVVVYILWNKLLVTTTHIPAIVEWEAGIIGTAIVLLLNYVRKAFTHR